jgi:hypothetical protein
MDNITRARLEELDWALDLCDISLPDRYSQPCLDEIIDKIKARIKQIKLGD